MGGMPVLRVVFVFALLIAPNLGAAQVGFQQLVFSNLKVGVWYPTDTAEQDGRLGPFDVALAFDAAPRAGAFQPVLMSHGNGGRYRNHHLTAKAIANAGFIVTAPLHTVDHLVDTTDRYKALAWRTEELRHAMEAVLQMPAFRAVMDISRVHAVRYSLGALTALNAAGMGLDGAVVETHCTTANDPAFCKPTPWLVRRRIKSLRGVTPPRLVRDIPGRFFPAPFVGGGVAVIAPVGRGAVYDGSVFQARAVFIVGLADDDITMPHYHAQYINDILPPETVAHFSIRPGHHHAFIAPFAKRVTDHEHIPVAIDPLDFDRTDFLTPLNAELAAFFVLFKNSTSR